MSAHEPSRKELLIEIAVFASLFLLVGAAFVIWRVGKQGSSVLTYAPHSGGEPTMVELGEPR